MREWNAEVYHRVSNPQFEWGLTVLERLALGGGELVLDVGCGTGRLTAKLADRVPRGRVIAVDQSFNMLAAAREYFHPHHGHHTAFVHANALALPFAGIADAIFSTATFHWIADHPRLFSSVFAALRPGGRLVAQCGGHGNLARAHEWIRQLSLDPVFAPHFARWERPWEFADAATTERRLREAGFVGICTGIEPELVTFPDPESFREFMEHIVARPFLARLEAAADRERFLDALTSLASRDSPPFQLDYWRLNLDARRPENR
jgi:trans-aconitate 2-methyltransferase